MKNRIKQILAITVVIALVGSLSSCNRGYGCPNNFKTKVVTTVVDNVVSNIVKK